MTHHPISGLGVGLIAGFAVNDLRKSQNQVVVDSVYRQAAAVEQVFAQCGQVTLEQRQTVIERDQLRAGGINPSWIRPKGSFVGNFVIALLVLWIPALIIGALGAVGGPGLAIFLFLCAWIGLSAWAATYEMNH